MIKPIFKMLQRYPLRNNETLQAWDAADELLLEYVGTLNLSNKRVLIINDQFGALSSFLTDFDITAYTDSYLSYAATKINTQAKVTPISDLKELSGNYDLVLIQLPKNLSFFEDILCHLTHHLSESSQVICCSMIKHMSSGSFELLQKYIGETTTSLAQKKARLIFAHFQKQRVDSPYPLKVDLDQFAKGMVNHSNIFSREKLDIGTRFFLENLPQGDFETILDLGCGNGIVGMIAKKLNPRSRIIFCDESYMAVLSAKENYHKHLTHEALFFWTNCFENQPENSVELILCNPPFHQGHTVADFIAWQMFTDAYKTLKVGGTIRVIGNSHLGYHLKLKKIFGKSTIIATNSKFMVVEATKTA